MAKVAFTKLGLKKNTEIKLFIKRKNRRIK